MKNLLNHVDNIDKPKVLSFALIASVFCCIIFMPIKVHSQTSDNNEETNQEPQEIERIIVSGQNFDDAMRAFKAGDFELAEIEYKKNAKCALRVERNKQALVSGLQNSSIDSSLQSTASIQSGARFQGGASGRSSTPTSGVGGNAGNRKNDTTVPSRTCTDRGYQLYMTGLSQIQLGRAEEAEKNFKTASFVNKNIYDAHYRIALMQLLRSDKEGAESRLSDIQDVLERCRDCEVREEILVRIDFLEKALSGEIKLN
jgi:hypothetical protein